MLLAMNEAPRRAPRLTVFAYDISSPKRARRVRKLLAALHLGKQYSVFETLLHPPACRGVLAELSELCDLGQDRLAVWWPRHSVRLEWRQGAAKPIARSLGAGGAAPAAFDGTGNFVLCYDIGDPDALLRVGAQVAAHGVFVQRSVYYLRLPGRKLTKVAASCAREISAHDRLWVYPLAGAGALWRIGAMDSSVLPIATDRWLGRRA